MTLQLFPFDRALPERRLLTRNRFLVAGAIVALSAIALVGWLNNRGAFASSVPGGQTAAVGLIEIAGTPFPFSPQTCAVLDGSFIAAGPGSNGFGDYWVSASDTDIEILFNVASEVDTPPDGFPWLESGSVGWSSPDVGQVVAVTRMTEARNLLTGGRGVLTLDCP